MSFDPSIYTNGKANVDTTIINYMQNFCLVPINQAIKQKKAMYLIGPIASNLTLYEAKDKNVPLNCYWQFFELGENPATKNNHKMIVGDKSGYGQSQALAIRNIYNNNNNNNFLRFTGDGWRMGFSTTIQYGYINDPMEGNNGANLSAIWVNTKRDFNQQNAIFRIINVNVNRTSGGPLAGLFDLIQIVACDGVGDNWSNKDKWYILVCQDDSPGGDGLAAYLARKSQPGYTGKAMYWKPYNDYYKNIDTYLQIGPGPGTTDGFLSSFIIGNGYYPDIPESIWTKTDMINVSIGMTIASTQASNVGYRTTCLTNSKKVGTNNCMNIYADNILGDTCRKLFQDRSMWTSSMTDIMNNAFTEYCKNQPGENIPGDPCYCVNQTNNLTYKDMQDVFDEIIEKATTTAQKGMYQDLKKGWNGRPAFCMLSSCRDFNKIDIKKTNSSKNIAGNVQYLPGIGKKNMKTYVCPATNIQQCNMLADLKNSGKIGGNVNINQSCNNSINTGSGSNPATGSGSNPGTGSGSNSGTKKSNNLIIYIIVTILVIFLLIILSYILIKLYKKPIKSTKYGKRQ